ncbi:flavin reductase family protein [Viridibacterium curvum]|uniref:Flavin reductase family protein n=1 Tax=Viridibacterium curvum TaxID=1101404 RepID=A0ABP9QNE6_9RHOO
MDINFATLTEYQRYKLMASLIVPRPIALVTTLSETGVVNAAPFSMFNMLGEEPPIVMISVNRKKDGGLKDTANNIVRSKEFVVHIADEEIAEKMHRCGDALPADASELVHVGLTHEPSNAVAPPRIVEAPVAFECRLWELLETESRQIFIGEVLWLHARDGLIDTERWRVRLQDFFPVGRFGASFYTRTRDRFVIGADGGEGRTTSIDEI